MTHGVKPARARTLVPFAEIDMSKLPDLERKKRLSRLRRELSLTRREAAELASIVNRHEILRSRVHEVRRLIALLENG